jgi:UDP-N-acetylglucosamine 2-epimerase
MQSSIKKLRVMTVVGTRPEIIRLSQVMLALDRHAEHIIVHTGQNYDYELNQIFFDELGLKKPDHFLNAAAANGATTIANVISAIDPILAETKPDALLILGDTNSTLAAISAKRRKIPIFHMEAGNRCFDMRVPEEINRRIVDHISDINLTYSSIARDYLLHEGLPPDRVIKTGSPMLEVLQHQMSAILASDVLTRMGVQREGYFVVSAHREENVDPPDALERLQHVLNGVAVTHGLPVLFLAHPRTRNRLERSMVAFHPLVQLGKPVGFNDYVHLQMNARAVLSDSGTISEESSLLNFPAVNLREAHERPEGMEEGAVAMTGLSLERVLQVLDILRSQKRGSERSLRVVKDYDVDNVSEKVVRIIHSYVDYVNRTVWFKT